MNAKKQMQAMAKTIETNQNDFISDLPDHLLHHILSLLPSTKEAIKTSVLSKRWQYVWTFIPNLIFGPNDFRGLRREGESHNLRRENVISSLDKTLSLHSSSKIDKLCIGILLDYQKLPLLDSRVDSWLSSAIGRGVERLSLCFGIKYFLPQFLYQNRRLLKLQTGLCKFVPAGRVSWDSLKVLNIHYTRLTDEVVQNILQGTPLLHSLIFDRCFGFNIIDLSHNTLLKILVMCDFYFGLVDLRFQITAPYLEEFEILGCWCNMECKLNMSCLVRATLDFKVGRVENQYPTAIGYGNIMKELLDNVRHAKQLKLGNWCLQVLSTLRLNVTPSLSSNCKCLILNIHHFDGSIIHGIACLLLNSHELEKLVLYFGRCSKKFHSDEEIPENYWTSHTEIFNCLEFHLKTIEIFGFAGSGLYSTYGFRFLRFLLAKGKVLERMVIHDTMQDSHDKFELEVAALLLSTASPSSAVVLLAD